MAKLQLFQYAVILHKKKETKGSEVLVDNIEDSKIIIEPTWVLAKDAKSVAFKATRSIKETDATDPEMIEIQVRNF